MAIDPPTRADGETTVMSLQAIQRGALESPRHLHRRLFRVRPAADAWEVFAPEADVPVRFATATEAIEWARGEARKLWRARGPSGVYQEVAGKSQLVALYGVDAPD
jgi:hypothetical protein